MYIRTFGPPAAALTLLLLLTAAALAQPAPRRLHYSSRFDPDHCLTVSGEVVRVEHAFSEWGDDYCGHALLRTPEGLITVILAPQDYMAQHRLTVATGDRLTVQGSLITILDRPFLLATQVSGDRQMQLRDEQGRPAWIMEPSHNRGK